MNTKDNKEWNTLSLIAWDEWKETCAILNCSPQNQSILATEVTKAFSKKYKRINVLDSLKSLFINEVDSEKTDSDKEGTRLPSETNGWQYVQNDEDEANLDINNNQIMSPVDSLLKDIHEEEENEADRKMQERIHAKEDDNEDSFSQDMESDDYTLNHASNQPFNLKKYKKDWAHIFDRGIIEKTYSEKTPKNYKDIVWKAMEESTDPKLQIIRGILLGPKGIINEIAEKLLREDYPQIWERVQLPNTEDQQDKRPAFQRRLVSMNQEDNKTNEDDTTTLEDIIPAEVESHLDESEESYIISCFTGAFSNENAAILLAKMTRISLDAKELKNYVGLSSTSIYERLNQVIFPKLSTFPQECLDSLQIPGASFFLISFLKKQLQAEKSAAPLLLLVDDYMEHN